MMLLPIYYTPAAVIAPNGRAPHSVCRGARDGSMRRQITLLEGRWPRIPFCSRARLAGQTSWRSVSRDEHRLPIASSNFWWGMVVLTRGATG